MPFYLTRSCPIDTWRVVQEPPTEGEWIALDVQWYQEAIAERDKANGKSGAEQGSLPI